MYDQMPGDGFVKNDRKTSTCKQTISCLPDGRLAKNKRPLDVILNDKQKNNNNLQTERYRRYIIHLKYTRTLAASLKRQHGNH